MLKGIAASSGVAVAKAYLLVQPDLSFETVTVENIENEEARLDAALAAAQSELQIIKDKAVDSLGEEAAAVFDAHMMVLADPDMTAQIKATIESKKLMLKQPLKKSLTCSLLSLKVWKTMLTCKSALPILKTLQNV